MMAVSRTVAAMREELRPRIIVLLDTGDSHNLLEDARRWWMRVIGQGRRGWDIRGATKYAVLSTAKQLVAREAHDEDQ